MSYAAVLFDLDGTLLDTLQDLADSTNTVLADCGFPTHDTDAYRTFVGDGVTKLFQRVLPPNVRREEVIACRTSPTTSRNVACGSFWQITNSTWCWGSATGNP